MDGIDAATKAALALGAFGSLLGLLNLGLKAIEVWRDRSSVRLGIHTGSGPFIPAGTVTIDPARHVYITVTNEGRRPVKITSAGLVHKDRTTLPIMVDSLGQHLFPAVLDERNPTVSVDVATDALRERYSSVGQPQPTHIFCYAADKRRTRRLRRQWVDYLTSAPRSMSGPGPQQEAGGGSETAAG